MTRAVVSFPPPWCPPQRVVDRLRAVGSAVLAPEALIELTGCTRAQLDDLRRLWNDLPPDAWLRDGGRYRHRRHGCFVVTGDAVTQAPHRAHWQPPEYNALHGGLRRWFEPLPPWVAGHAAWNALLRAMARVADGLRGAQPWHVEAHPFRIDTTDGIGRPTPEGAHRDGVDLVAVVLVERRGVVGGETRVFDAHGPDGQRFTLTEPWTALLLDDARVIHETTPIRPAPVAADPVEGAAASSGGASTAVAAHRDTLVLTLRAGGFQGD